MGKRKQSSTAATMSKFAKDLAVNPRQEKLEQLLRLVGKQVTLPIDSLITNENIRSDLGVEEAAFAELVSSIKEHGILQNIVVELRERDDNELFELVCVEGHRRVAAAKQLGITTAPCFLKKFASKHERTKAALACTIKEELHPIDRASVYAEWIASGSTLDEVAKKDNKNAKTVQRFMKILDWPNTAKELVRHNKKSFPTWWLFQNILQKSLNDTEIETLIKKRLGAAVEKAQKPRGKTPLVKSEKDFLKKLNAKVGVKSQIRQRQGKKFLEVELTNESFSVLANIL